MIAGAAYLAGQYLRGVWFQHLSINTCRYATDSWGVFCNSPYLDQGYALLTLAQVIAITAAILLFVNAATFRKWLKFSAFYIPVATALTLWMYPAHTFLGGVAPVSQGVHLFGNLYIIITLGIVLWDFLASRRAGRKV